MSTWTTYCYIHTYMDTYIHRYSEFTICYSCIQGSLRLALNYSYTAVPCTMHVVIYLLLLHNCMPSFPLAHSYTPPPNLYIPYKRWPLGIANNYYTACMQVVASKDSKQDL